MDDCQHLDKLTETARGLIAYMLENFQVGWDVCHAVEVRLNDPVENICNGGKGNLVTHGGSDARCYIKHYGDNAWAVIHHADPQWQALDRQSLCVIGRAFIDKNKEIGNG